MNDFFGNVTNMPYGVPAECYNAIKGTIEYNIQCISAHICPQLSAYMINVGGFIAMLTLLTILFSNWFFDIGWQNIDFQKAKIWQTISALANIMLLWEIKPKFKVYIKTAYDLYDLNIFENRVFWYNKILILLIKIMMAYICILIYLNWR